MQPAYFTPARTITAADGRVLLFSCDQFVSDICNDDCCFICGAKPESKPFNDEHIIPKWVLRRFGLFDQKVTLPNGERQRYRGYTLPCCQECNHLLGERVEASVSELLAGTYEEIVARLDSDRAHLLFRWLCLLFLKTHLKDRSVRFHLDARKGSEKIGENYLWPDLHHLHCVARASYSRADIEAGVVGSLAVFKIEDPTSDSEFDYLDLTDEQTVVLRLGDFGLAAVLNDSGAAAIGIRHRLGKIDGSLTMVQLREVGARLAVANSDLLNRPSFGSLVSKEPPERVLLWAKHDSKPTFAPLETEKIGSALALVLKDRIHSFEIEGERNPQMITALLKTGRYSFLFDQNGDFTPAKITFETLQDDRANS